MGAEKKLLIGEEKGRLLSDVIRLERWDLMYKWRFWICRIITLTWCMLSKDGDGGRHVHSSRK